MALAVRGGQVRSAKVFVEGSWPERASASNLGLVGTGAALVAFIELARTGGSSSDDILFPLTLADSIVVWPAFLSLARDKAAPAQPGNRPCFWSAGPRVRRPPKA